MAKFDNNDDRVVVVIGSGRAAALSPTSCVRRASRWCCWRPASTTALRTSPTTSGTPSGSSPGSTSAPRREPGGWRRTFSGPARVDLQDRGRLHHPLGGRKPSLPGARAQSPFRLRGHRGRDAPRLAAEPGGSGAVLRQGRGQDGGHTDERHPRPARQQQLQGDVERCEAPRLQGRTHRTHGHQQPASRRAPCLPAARVLLPGLQDGRQVVDPVHRDPESRGHRQSGSPSGEPSAHHHPQRPRGRRRRGVRRRGRQPAPPGRTGGVRGGATPTRAPGCCSTPPRRSSPTDSPTHRAKWGRTTCGT